MTLNIPGIPLRPSVQITTVSFIITERAYVQTVKSPVPRTVPPASHTAHAPTHPISRPAVLWTALSGDEEAVEGRGQW